VIAKRAHCDTTNFGIFTSQIVFRDHRLNLIAHCLVDRHLASDCRTTSGFRPAASFGQRATMSGFDAPDCGSAFPSGERAAQLAFHRSHRCRLFASDQRALAANVTSRQAAATTAARASRSNGAAATAGSISGCGFFALLSTCAPPRGAAFLPEGRTGKSKTKQDK
jgi:hypothetical protein